MRSKLVAVLLALFATVAHGLGTGFTYQGRLADAGSPATGVYDLEFKLFDSLAGAGQVGSTLVMDNLTVTGGLFTVQLDFGAAAFDGNDRWLEISVRPGASSGSYTTLSPRQPLTPSPHALYSNLAGAVVNESVGSSQIVNASIQGTDIAAGQVVRSLNGQTDAITFSGTNGIGVSAGSGTLSVTSNATPANTPSAIVMRDGSGSFSAGAITLAGNLNLPNTASGTVGVLLKGGAPFLHNFGFNNTFLGADSGSTGLTGEENTGVGQGALTSLSAANDNSAFGRLSLASATTGGSNAAFGARTMLANATGFGNAAFGHHALRDHPNGAVNSAFGESALSILTSGDSNIAIGAFAGSTLTSGSDNIYIGHTGVASESNTLRLGSNQTATHVAGIFGRSVSGGSPVFVDSTGRLGTTGGSIVDDDQPDNDSEVPDAITVSGTITAAATINLNTTASTVNGVLSYDAAGDRFGVGDGTVTDYFYPGLRAGSASDGGPATTALALNSDPAACPVGQVVRDVAANGTLTCVADANSGGTVTSITAGTGLTGGTITTSGTMAVNFGTTATTVAEGNHNHFLESWSGPAVNHAFRVTNTTPGGMGIVGAAPGSNGAGIFGSASAAGGIGVYGRNVAAGVTYGIFGQVSSSSGWAGYFDGPARVVQKLSVDDSVGIGLGATAPATPLDIGIGTYRFQVRDEGGLTPGINLAGSGGTVGILRLRRKLEVWPDDAAANAGSLDVRNTAGAVTISLNGATGTVSKLAGSFKIDHPLDPTNKYLYHSFVESPDMMNIYNGNVTSDERGYAVVELPAWFEALNRDFRYQLTVMGDGAWARARVLKKIDCGRFTIQTDVPSVEVSWQVTGIRKDAFAERHRIPVEEDKPAGERGTLLYPDAYGKR